MPSGLFKVKAGDTLPPELDARFMISPETHDTYNDCFLTDISGGMENLRAAKTYANNASNAAL